MIKVWVYQNVPVLVQYMQRGHMRQKSQHRRSANANINKGKSDVETDIVYYRIYENGSGSDCELYNARVSTQSRRTCGGFAAPLLAVTLASYYITWVSESQTITSQTSRCRFHELSPELLQVKRTTITFPFKLRTSGNNGARDGGSDHTEKGRPPSVFPGANHWITIITRAATPICQASRFKPELTISIDNHTQTSGWNSD